MKYFLKTYGCQMNKSDSERIAAVLELAGYKKTSQESDADLIVLNVCSVRQSAIDRIFGNIKKYNEYRKNNPNFKTVITGCILENDRRRFEKLFDLVIDIKEIEKFSLLCHSEFISESTEITGLVVPMPLKPSAVKIGAISDYKQKILKQVQNDNEQALNENNTKKDYTYFNINPTHQSKFTAYVPIMTGCDNFCSYCVVPYTRGRERSRPVEEIIAEITNLVNKGYKEIILLGQNVNSYKGKLEIGNWKLGNSKYQKPSDSNNLTIEQFSNRTINFLQLLKLIDSIPGDFWIRFLTSHPKDMTEELIKTVSECEKCAEYIHLALQSGDNEILKKMNRKYTAEYFLELIRLMGKYIPNAAISTDVIVGFPGETEEQFQHTAKIMKKVKFDMAYINKYSPRAGTAASKLDDNVNWKEKKRREKILTEILKETAVENNKKYIGKTIDILVVKTDNNFIYGKTRTFKNVKIAVTKKLRNHKAMAVEPASVRTGQFVKMKITKINAFGLEGEIKGCQKKTILKN